MNGTSFFPHSDDIEDVFWLGQCFYHTGQYPRALHLLTSHDLLSYNKCCLYLAVRCRTSCKEWEEALSLLDKNLALCQQRAQPDSSAGQFEEKKVTFTPLSDVDSAIELLKGTILETLDNRAGAIASYTRALRLNIYCVEVGKLMAGGR